MAKDRTLIDLGFAEFAAQLVAELQEAVSAAQSEQEALRAELAARAVLDVAQFARRFVSNADVDAELVRLFPSAGGRGTAVAAGRPYRPAGTRQTEMPPVASKLRIKLGPRDLRKRGSRLAFTGRGVASIRTTVRLRLAEFRQNALRQMVTQGLPRVVVDSGRVNVKLTFQLVDLDKLGARPNAAIVPLKPLLGASGKADALKRLRLVVRQVNEDTTPPEPSAASGIGELDLTFKTA